MNDKKTHLKNKGASKLLVYFSNYLRMLYTCHIYNTKIDITITMQWKLF